MAPNHFTIARGGGPLTPDRSRELRSAGQLAKVLFEGSGLRELRGAGLNDRDSFDSDLAMGPPSRAALPPLLTAACHSAARDMGIALVPGVIVTEAEGALKHLRHPRDENGVVHIGMARLAQDFVRAMFSAMQNPPPVLLTLEEAAALIRVAPDTLKHMVSDGRIYKSVKRGKPLIFVRDLLVQEWMAGR